MVVRVALDFISPYAYLGWKRAHRELVPMGVTLQPVPVLFAAFLNANGTKGPAEIPSKRLYTWKHVVRLATAQGVPITPPPAHPFNPLLSLRVVACDLSASERVRAIDALYDAAWGGGPGVTDPDTVAGLLDDAGLPGRALVEQTQSPEIKARIKTNTAEALQAGVFGVPSFIVGDEVFWGQDSVPHVAAHLRGEDPVTDADLQRWADLPAGSVRSGSR